MREKLPRFFLLSFVSFCFFTVVFHTFAYAEELTSQTTVQSPLAAKTATTVPTPTIYIQSLTDQQQSTIKESTDTPPSPTPTIYIAFQPHVTPTATPTPQPTSVPTEIPTVEPTATPLPTTVPTSAPAVQQGSTDLEALFSQYSAQYNVSEDELKKIAQCESGFNTMADTGLYAGMFQFSASTWESERGIMGLDPNPDLRKDAGEAIRTTAFMLSRGQENAWPNCH